MEELEVRIDFGSGARTVGRLIREETSIYFRYASTYLVEGSNLSPFKLQWNGEPQRADVGVFGGLFGVFADSLPDGWGRLLLDRQLVRSGIDLNSINPLDRLAYVGMTGKGALTYHPVAEAGEELAGAAVALDELSRQAAEVLNDRDVEALPTLLQLGGSSGGARPKVQVLYNLATGDLIPDTLPVPPGYDAWIVKFSAREDAADAARTEYAYYKAALQAGIDMAESRLITGKAGRIYFSTKRFDRGEAGTRTHLHSLAGLLHDNFRLPAIDYGHVMDAAFRLEQDIAAYQKVLRIAAFNVFTHNRDDHSNNLSFLMNAGGEWLLAPAYDLTFSRPEHGQHSITVGGEGRSPGWKQLRELAAHFAVPESEALLGRVWEAAKTLPDLLRDNGVGASTVRALQDHLDRF